MLILSKFHDYYDSALTYGVDKTVVYKRETTECKIEGTRKNLRTSSDFFRGVVLFCGQEINFAELNFMEDKFARTNSKHYVYSINDVDKLLTKYPYFAETHPTLHEGHKEKVSRWQYMYGESINNRRGLENWFKSSSGKNLTNIHFDHDAPVLLKWVPNRNSKAYRNPVLKDLEFFKVKDAYTAFNDIMQYVSGVMGGQTPKMVEIDDIHKIEGHGFDKVTSFRKAPTKRK